MQEQLITFETATLAKDKGFNGPTTHYYVRKYGVHFEDHKTPLKCYIGEDEDSNLLQLRVFKDGQPHLVCAPTQSLLQKWLRDKHKIDIVVHGFKKQPVGEEIWDEVYQVFVLDFAYHPYFKSYEEALEEGLIQALRKIE